MSLINRTDFFHERMIAAKGGKIAAQMKGGSWADAHAAWPDLRKAILARGPDQIARMEQKIFRRAA